MPQKTTEPTVVNKTQAPQTESKLFIQEPVAPKQAFKEAQPVTTVLSTQAKEPVAVTVEAEPVSQTSYQSKSKRSLLSALRDKYGDQYTIEEVDEAEPLEMEKLRECWYGFAAKLEEQQKHSAANTFKIAKLTIQNETTLADNSKCACSAKVY